MLQIGAGDASKFEFLTLRILLRSSRSEHFWSKNGRKWKVTESFKTCSWDVLVLGECSWVILRLANYSWTIFEKVAFLRFLSDFWSQLTCSNAIAIWIEGCFAPPPVQGAQGPQRWNQRGSRELGQKHSFWTFWHVFCGWHHLFLVDSNCSQKILQIGTGDASKFEFLRLGILLRSSGSRHFWSKNGQKWKVPKSFKTCSWDVPGARGVFPSEFKTRQ